MDKFLKIYKNYYTKDKNYNNIINKLDNEHNKYYDKHNKLLINFLNNTFKNFLGNKYIINFKLGSSELYFHLKEAPKEDFILKIILIKQELSLTPNNYTSYKILLNTNQYKDINVLIDIGKLSQLFSKNITSILTKINSLETVYDEYVKYKMLPKFKETFLKLNLTQKSTANQILKTFLKSPLVFPTNSPFTISFAGRKFSEVTEIQLKKLNSQEEHYNILFITNIKNKDGSFLSYNLEVQNILKFITNSILPPLAKIYFEHNLAPVE